MIVCLAMSCSLSYKEQLIGEQTIMIVTWYTLILQWYVSSSRVVVEVVVVVVVVHSRNSNT